MTKYLLKRLLLGLLSACTATILVMIMVYSLMSREMVFAGDTVYTRKINNTKELYRYSKWEEYGYLDFVQYSEYINDKSLCPGLDEKTRQNALTLGRTSKSDNKTAKQYTEKFAEYYEAKGYTIKRLDAVTMGNRIANGGTAQLFAYKDVPLIKRILSYFGSIFDFDNIHKVNDDVGERKLKFTLFDPVYGGEKFSPAIMGNGTEHKYLVYFDDSFPYFHQNLLTINLGRSYSVEKGTDIFKSMTQSQGSYEKKELVYPTGERAKQADNLHTAVYAAGSRETNPLLKKYFVDDYTKTQLYKSSTSKIGFSFILGIISSFFAYLIGIPLGILMARKKDKLADKIGTMYIIFSLAVPALAYIFMVKAIGNSMGIPTTFDFEHFSYLMVALPIISLMLPSIGSLMRWLRRYMIDQSNADYVRFARSGGLSEREIFSKHIFKNAAIPIVHGIPGTILGALVGAIITERVYVIPGAGNLLTTAINAYDNSVIVGLTLFYALLSVVSIILGDLLITMVDPRISFVSKAR